MSEIDGAVITILAEAPNATALTEYDLSHFLTYARLIDAERGGTHWCEAARDILLCAVERDPEGSLRCWESHLARAHWVVKGPVSV